MSTPSRRPRRKCTEAVREQQQEKKAKRDEVKEFVDWNKKLDWMGDRIVKINSCFQVWFSFFSNSCVCVDEP